MIKWPDARPFEGAGIVAGDVQKAKNAILDFYAIALGDCILLWGICSILCNF